MAAFLPPVQKKPKDKIPAWALHDPRIHGHVGKASSLGRDQTKIMWVSNNIASSFHLDNHHCPLGNLMEKFVVFHWNTCPEASTSFLVGAHDKQKLCFCSVLNKRIWSRYFYSLFQEIRRGIVHWHQVIIQLMDVNIYFHWEYSHWSSLQHW